jgi:hypothetical protein
MDNIRNRARENLPSVLLTLLSIIQAIALESLWDHARHRPELYGFSWDALLGWLQIAVTLNVIVLIWMVYVGLVMRFRWTPAMTDSILPFLVGLIQFLMIDLMGPENLGKWILVLGLIAVVVTYLDHSSMRRARRDPDNREFFEKIPAAEWRDFIPQGISVLFSVVAGTWLWYSGDYGWIALLVLLFALTAMAYNAYIQAKFWRVSMGD